jgi:hypothetical protein
LPDYNETVLKMSSTPKFFRLVRDSEGEWYVPGDVTLPNGDVMRESKEMGKLWDERQKLCTALDITEKGAEAFRLAQHMVDQTSHAQIVLRELRHQIDIKLGLIDGVEATLGRVVGDALEQVKRSQVITRRSKAELRRLLKRLITKRKIIGAQRRVIRQLRKQCLHLIKEETKQNGTTAS